MSWFNHVWNNVKSTVATVISWGSEALGFSNTNNTHAAVSAEYLETEAAIKQALHEMESTLETITTPQTVIALYQGLKRADLNHDGILSGKEETIAIFNETIKSSPNFAQMIRSGMETMAELSKALPQETLDMLIHGIEEGVHLEISDKEHVAFDKKMGAAIQAGQEEQINSLYEQIHAHTMEKFNNNIENDSIIQLIDSVPGLTEKEQESLGALYGASYNELMAKHIYDTIVMSANHPEIVKAALEQPDIGEVEKLSWTEMVRLSREAPETAQSAQR